MRDQIVHQLMALGVDTIRPPFAGLSDHALRQILAALQPRGTPADTPRASPDDNLLSDPWVRRAARSIPQLRAVIDGPDAAARSSARAFATNFDLLPDGPVGGVPDDRDSNRLLADPWVRRAARHIPQLRAMVEAAEESDRLRGPGEEGVREFGTAPCSAAFGGQFEEAKHPRDEKGRWVEKGKENPGPAEPPAGANPLPAHTPVYQVKFDKNRIDRSVVWDAIRRGKAIPEKDDWYKKTEYLQPHSVQQTPRSSRTVYEKAVSEKGVGLVAYSEVTDDGMLHYVILEPVTEHYGGRSYDPKGTSYYRVVEEQHLPLGITGKSIGAERERLTGKDYARRAMERYQQRESLKRQGEQEARGYAFLEGVLQGALHALPGGSTADLAVHGGSNEDWAFAALGDIASAAGPIGIAMKGTRAGKAIFVAAQGVDGGLAATRAVQAAQAYNRGEDAKGHAYLTETFLRLAGMTVNQVGWTKATPKAPPVKTEPVVPKNAHGKVAKYFEGVNESTTDDLFVKYAGRVKPKEGYFDLYVHGYDNGKAFGKWNPQAGAAEAADLLDIARALQQAGWKPGEPIRLLSCRVGEAKLRANAAAQKLANYLKVEVLAPSERIWLFKDGSFVHTMHRPASSNVPHTGTWYRFRPGHPPAKAE